MARPCLMSPVLASAFPACANAWPNSVAASTSNPVPPVPPFALLSLLPRLFPRRLSMAPLRILIADDHAVVRTGLRTLLESRDGWQVCAEAVDGRDAVEKATKHKPDVAVLDIGM